MRDVGVTLPEIELLVKPLLVLRLSDADGIRGGCWKFKFAMICPAPKRFKGSRGICQKSEREKKKRRNVKSVVLLFASGRMFFRLSRAIAISENKTNLKFCPSEWNRNELRA